MKKLFGTDGIRGIVDKDLTPELAFRVGRAFGSIIQEQLTAGRKVVIGRDTRSSCEVLESSLSSGLATQGVDVSLVGIIPTPGLAFLTRTGGFAAGIMISASHNPAEYNGLKFIGRDGFKLSDQDELKIESLLENYDRTNFPNQHPGAILRDINAATKYLDYLRQVEKVPLSGLKVVLDLANGAAYSMAPQLVASLGASVKLISDKPNGANINVNCGSTHIENLQKVMRSEHADVGLAFDGDGDRILAVDEKAEIVDGDQIILIAALELAHQGRLHNNIVVTTVLSNYGLEEALQRHNIILKRTQVGDRYVVEEMIRSGATLGGEQSGHVVFLDYNTAGDGLITAVKILATLKKSGRKLSTLASEMVRYPQVHLNVKVRNTSDWESNHAIREAVSNAERAIRGQGRVVVRASGTEPLIRIMVEGKDDSVIRQMAQELAEVVRSAIGFQ